MDRRKFLEFLSGGLVASATMAEAGAFSEFMDWIRRAPAWSFPSPVPVAPMFDLITATTLEHLRENIVYDNLFVDSPFIAMLKYDGGVRMVEPFSFDNDTFKLSRVA